MAPLLRAPVLDRRLLLIAAAFFGLLSSYYVVFVSWGHTLHSLAGAREPPRGADIAFPVLASGGPLGGDLPPVEGLVWPRTLCAGGARRPRVAVCLLGAVRTFLNPVVHESQIDNILRALGAERTDVFIHFQERSASALNQTQLLPIMARFRPVRYEIELVNRSLGAELFNWRCRMPPMSDMRRWGWPWGGGYILDSFAGQYRTLQRCFAAVQAREAEQGYAYDFVVKTRADLVLFQSLPPICTYSPHHIYGSTDLVMVIPRKAEAVLDLLGSYRNCSGFRAGIYTPEQFMMETGRAAGFPFVALGGEVMMMRGYTEEAQGGPCNASALFSPFRGQREHRCVDIVSKNPSNVGRG